MGIRDPLSGEYVMEMTRVEGMFSMAVQNILVRGPDHKDVRTKMN